MSVEEQEKDKKIEMLDVYVKYEGLVMQGVNQIVSDKTYRWKSKVTGVLPLPVAVLVTLSDAIQVSVDKFEESPLHDLYMEHGPTIIPMPQRGLFSLLWERKYKGTSKQDRSLWNVEKTAKRSVKESEKKMIFLTEELFLDHVVVKEGKGRILESFMYQDVQWLLCDQSTEREVDVPKEVLRFFQDTRIQNIPLRFADIATYQSNSKEYAYQKFSQHLDEAKKLLAVLSQDTIVLEPAAGVGILTRLRSGVEAGDLHLNELTDSGVKRETIGETIKTHGSAPIVLMYCWGFMTSAEKSLLIGRRFIIIDDDRKVITGLVRVQRNVWIGGEFPEFDKWILGDKKHNSEKIEYSHNLMTGVPYTILYLNEPYHYLQVMMPQQPLVSITKMAKCKMVAQNPKRLAPLLVSSLSEFFDSQQRNLNLPIYFSPIGQIVEVKDVFLTVGVCDMRLKKRTIYRGLESPLLAAMVMNLPSGEYQGYRYFFFGGDEDRTFRWKYRDMVSVREGSIVFSSRERVYADWLEATPKRVYRYSGTVTLSVDKFVDTAYGLALFLRSYYAFGMEKDVWDRVQEIWSISSSQVFKPAWGTQKWGAIIQGELDKRLI